MVKLKDVFFGFEEGKDEANDALQWNKFEEIFYPGFGSYDEMLLPHKFLVIGRKGTGKTLLAEYFKNEQRKEDNKVIIIDESNFTVKKLEKMDYRGITEQEMIVFWEYFFCTEIAKNIKEEFSGWKWLTSSKYRKLSKVLKNKKFQVTKMKQTETDKLASSLKALVGEKSSAGIGINRNSEFTTSKELEESPYYDELKDYKEAIISCKKILEGKKIFIIFDDLDELEIFAETFESKKRFILTMVRTIRRMNSEFVDNDVPIKMFALMRQDMADDLNDSNNFNKILNSNSINLKWNYNHKIGVMNQPLTQMLVRKVKQSSEEFQQMNDMEVYNSLLPGKVKGQVLVKHLIDNSFGRPRDFVLFLNTIKENYPEKEKIRPAFFQNSYKDYSLKFYRELENEINRNANKIFLKEGIQLIRDNKLMTFTLEEIIETYEKNPIRYPAISNKSLIEDCLKELYTYNVVGTSVTVINENEKDSNIVEFFYRNNSIKNPDLSNMISVHFALRPALNVIAAKKKTD